MHMHAKPTYTIDHEQCMALQCCYCGPTVNKVSENNFSVLDL